MQVGPRINSNAGKTVPQKCIKSSPSTLAAGQIARRPTGYSHRSRVRFFPGSSLRRRPVMRFLPGNIPAAHQVPRDHRRPLYCVDVQTLQYDITHNASR